MSFHYYGPLSSESRLYQQRQGITADGEKVSDISRFIANACIDAAVDGVRSYFTVSGSRQSGKTSTLLETSQRVNTAGGYPCWLDFQLAYGATPQQSLHFTAQQICRAIPELRASATIRADQLNNGLGFDHWLLELPIPEGKPVVLLMEELGALPLETRKFLGGLLRGAFMRKEHTAWGKVLLVLFGGIELYDMVSVEVSPLRNICKNVSLMDLERSDTQALVAAGFDPSGNFNKDELNALMDGIYELVSGHPYLTQYLGDKALNYYKKSGELPAGIETVLSQLRVEDSEYIQYLDKSIQKYNLTPVAKEMLQKQSRVHPDQNAINRLSLLGVLGPKTETGYGFRNHLIQTALEKIMFSDEQRNIARETTRDLKPEIETEVVRTAKMQDMSERLSSLSCMETAESRQKLLAKSGMQKLRPKLEIENAKAVIKNLMDLIEDEPTPRDGDQLLGLLLTSVKTSLSPVEKDVTNLIDALITDYGLVDPRKMVFVSYAWGGESERTVDELELAFADRGISIVRDKKDLIYKGSINQFERCIGQGQCVVIVISDKYLRSEHCMYELVEIAENKGFQKRVFPIVLPDARIYRPVERLDYIRHWDTEIQQLNDELRKMNVLGNLTGFTNALDQYCRIRSRFDNLTILLGDMNTLTPNIIASNGFATLINAVEAAQVEH